MEYLDLALNLPLNKTFLYSFDRQTHIKNPPEFGKRVSVHFGSRKMTAVVIKIYRELPEKLDFPPEKIRPIEKVLDNRAVFTEENLDLANWISRYYICTIGEAVFAMLPSAKKETSNTGMSFDMEFSEEAERILSEEQTNAINKIILSYKKNRTLYHYLFGNTGTGKTEVFLQTAKKTIENGKGVIYLVPEIALTQQVAQAAVKRFGNTAAVIHSNLTPSQKLNQWNKIISGEAKFVIGARSAVFAPVQNLGLIIIDEEHDGSYKSGTTPRYHARQAAMYRCTKLGIPLLMGSATPSVEAWNLMETGRLTKHSLTKRLSGGTMPKIKCIDLLKTQDSGSISDELAEKVREVITQKRQVILFLNRRGFTHFYRCNNCGYELKCKNCSIAMTYHKNENRLKCHYCGWTTEPPKSCPKCNSLEAGYSGFGTEYIESEAHSKFPNARILRVDTDSASKKDVLQEKISKFEKGDYDIMLGTQMIAKGLNFPRLKLVGIIMADTGLYMPDFRAAERTFSLITQVAGRAGRFFPDGEVLVQTYNPFAEPIRYAVSANTQAFYDYELKQRKSTGFPPYNRIIRLVFRSVFLQKAQKAAEDAAEILKKISSKKIQIIGPAECPILKISQNYRYQIILRGQNILELQQAASHLITEYTHSNQIYIECDVDPVNML